MDRVRHATILPFPRDHRSGSAKQCGRNIQKNGCRTTVLSRFGETPGKLPFTGDQVVSRTIMVQGAVESHHPALVAPGATAC
jgi:hypothetical protein